MTEKSNTTNFSKLDNPIREEMIPTEKILNQLEINKDSVVADIGCGVGYFTFPISKRVKKVFAVDVSLEMITELKKRMEDKKIENIEIIKTMGLDFRIKDGSVNMVMLCTVLHEIDGKVDFMKRINTLLEDSGQLCIIEWIEVKKQMGPPSSHRIGLEAVKKIAQETSFDFYKEIEVSDEFYGIVFKKTQSL